MVSVPVPAGYALVQRTGGITEYRLTGNGLRLLVVPDFTAPVVTFMVTFLVGSRNEATGHTGATHLLEHLMFKGTPRYHRAAGTQIATVLKNVGAYYNATTWYDRTNYYELVPRDALPVAVALEADRMRHALLSDEDRVPEMTVVRNEFERLENSPESVLGDRVFAHAFLAHPYHHATIGWKSDIEGVTTARLRQFYDDFYHPDNAVALLVGDFELEPALGLIRDAFGVHPPAPRPIPVLYTSEPVQDGERRFEIHRAGELALVYVAQKIPAAGHPDLPALHVLARILSAGKTSRLYRALIDANLAVSQASFAYSLRDPALFMTRVAVAPSAERAAVEAAVVQAYAAIAEQGVAAAELATAQRKLAAETAYDRDGTMSVASRLNEAIAAGDWTLYVEAPARIAAVTAADVQRVAATYFTRETRTVGHFVPRRTDVAPQAPPAPDAAPPALAPQATPPAPAAAAVVSAGSDGSAPAAPPCPGLTPAPEAPAAVHAPAGRARFADRVRLTRLAGGVTLAQLPTAARGVVSLRAQLLAGDAQSPPAHPMLADLTCGMLDRGTLAADKFAFAEALERVGAQLGAGAGGFTVDLSGRCLRADLPLLLTLAADMLRRPRFDPAEFAKLKPQRTAQLRRLLDDTGAQAADLVARLIYPPGHPSYATPVPELLTDVERVQRDELKAFHADTYGGTTLTLVLTGDLAPDEVEALCDERFGDFAGGRPYTPPPRTPAAEGASLGVVRLHDKASVDLRLGHACPLRPGDPDYLAFALANRVLGYSALSSRLGLRVRDTEGLTYGISSGLSTSRLADGPFTIALTVAPENIERALQAVRDELRRFVDGGLTPDELRAEQQAMAGRFQVALGFNSGALASQILYVLSEGLGLDYLDDYPARVQALTLAEVNGAARRYLHPERLHVAAAGSIDDSLRPLPR